MFFVKSAVRAALPLALSFAAQPASAGPQDVVQNGGFESTTMSTPSEMNATNVADWTTNGYNFIFAAGNPNSYTPQFNATLQMWGPDVGVNNGFTYVSPTGGNYVGADGAYEVGAISQTLTGLDKGGVYAVSFSYAGAQQYGFNGPTTEAWTVSLGSQSFETPILQNASHGFTGWQQETFYFTATSTSEVLSFLADGTPDGQPPFSLLDGVTAFEVPEPGTWGVLALGLGGMCFVGWRRARQARGA